jgi:hypothetical protein
MNARAGFSFHANIIFGYIWTRETKLLNFAINALSKVIKAFADLYSRIDLLPGILRSFLKIHHIVEGGLMAASKKLQTQLYDCSLLSLIRMKVFSLHHCMQLEKYARNNQECPICMHTNHGAVAVSARLAGSGYGLFSCLRFPSMVCCSDRQPGVMAAAS